MTLSVDLFFSFRSPYSYLALPDAAVPTFVFENEPFFGQDRIGILIWRMESKGLTRRC
jgi:2-hydroxychromene-2-carboxylate isomerase